MIIINYVNVFYENLEFKILLVIFFMILLNILSSKGFVGERLV